MSDTEQSNSGDLPRQSVAGRKKTLKMKSGDKPEAHAAQKALQELPPLDEGEREPTSGQSGTTDKTLESAGTTAPLGSVTAEFDPLVGAVKAHPFRGGVQMAYEQEDAIQRHGTGGMYSDDPPGMEAEHAGARVGASPGPLADAVEEALPTEPIDRKAVEAAAGTKSYSLLDDPELDQELLKQMSAEDLAELERKLARVDALYAEQEAAPPPEAKDVNEGNDGVMASDGKAAARAAVSGSVPKRIKAKTQIVKKVVERSRILNTQPAMQRPLPPSDPEPAVEAEAAQEPKPRVGIWFVGALLVVAVGVIMFVAMQEPERMPPQTDDASATAAVTATITPTQARKPASTETTAAPQPPAPITAASTVSNPTPPTVSETAATSPAPPRLPVAPTKSTSKATSPAPSKTIQVPFPVDD